jgi:anti-sigma B factor antagonist
MPTDIAARNLRIHTEEQRQTATVKCSGRLVAGDTDVLKTHIKELLQGRNCIVIDLAELSQIDSSGLGTIVGLYISAKRENCDLVLINYNKAIRELLGLTNLLSVFEAVGRSHMRLP